MRLSNFFLAFNRQTFFAPSVSLLTALMFLLLFSLLVAASYADSFTTQSNNENAKSVSDFRKDATEFIKRTKNKSNSNQRMGAIVDLCFLHHQLVSDPRFGTNQQLQGFRARTADRLVRCKREIEVDMKRWQRTNGGPSHQVEQTKNRRSSDLSDEMEFEELAMVLDMQILTQLSGGPVNLWGHTGQHFGPNGICDHGPDLVRLIETTISPESWQRNGGTGVIHYYRPLRILVVSASSQVHDNVTDLLHQLR